MKTLILLALILAWQAPVPRTISTSEAAKLRPQTQGPTEAQVARLVADAKACDATLADINAKEKEGRFMSVVAFKAKFEAAHPDLVLDPQTFAFSAKPAEKK